MKQKNNHINRGAKSTPKNSVFNRVILGVLFSRFKQLLVASVSLVVVSSFLAVSLPVLYTGENNIAQAAPNNTLNFQARLLTNTGALVPDGNYHIEFKIYDQASGGSLLWTETRTTGNLVSIKNGYISVPLGSVTAFPGTIDWGDDNYLTMNVGGAGGSASWNGEMAPRMLITSVPYAFRAAEATSLKAFNGANSTTLTATAPTGTNSILLPDASGTICLQNSSVCGFATLAGANTFTGINTFSSAGTALQVTNNASIGGTLSVTGLTTATGGLTTGNGSLFTNGGATLNNTLAIGNLDYSGSGNTGSIGAAASTVDIYTNFTIAQTTAGQTITLPAPTSTTTGRLIYVTNVGSAGYNMAGSVVSPGVTMQFVWNSTTSSWSLVTSGTSGSYIQNGTSLQTANFNIQSNAVGSVTATIQGANSQTANILEVKQAGVGTAVFSISAAGDGTFSNNLSVNGNTTIGNATTDRLTVTSQLLGQDALVFQGATDDGFTTTFRVTDPTVNNILTLPNESGTICTTGSVCTGYAPSATNGYVQFAPASAQADATNNASIYIDKTSATGNLLQLQRVGTDVVSVSNTGQTLFRNTSNSATAFRVQRTTSDNIFAIETNTNRIKVGNDSAGSGADTTLFIVDTATTANQPTGVNGGIFYDTTLSKFRCYENGAYKDCDTGVTAVGAISGSANANGATITGTTINLTPADGSNGGVLTSGVQTIGGAKTFNGLVTGSAGASVSGGAVSLTGNAASSLTTTTGALTLTSAAAATWSTTAGNLTLQAGSGTVSLGTSTALTASGALGITSGGANALTLDTGGAASLSVGLTNANAISISRTGITTTVNGNLTVAENTNLNGNTTIGDAATDRLTVTSQILGGSPLVFQGATDNGFATTFAITDPTANNIITFPNSSGTVQLAPTSGSYIKQVPTSTAENTITPTTNSVVGLTVNGTSGTAATALAVSQPGAAAGITVASANNTATNGLSFSGTFTNLISSTNFSVTNAGAVTAVGVNSGTGLLQGTGGLTVTGTTNINATGAGTTNIGNGSAGAIAIQSGGAVNITAGAASTWSTGANSLTVTSSNFNVSSAGVITAAGAQTRDLTTAAAATANALTIGPGSSTAATGTGAALNLRGGDQSGTTTSTGGAISILGGNATGASGTRNGGAATIDAGTGATANGAVNIGNTNAASIGIGRSGITTTVTGGLTQTTGAVSLTGNAASSLTTSAGALTLTSAAAATWSTAAGNLTLQAGSGTVSLGTSTALTATGALGITSGGANALTLDTGGAASLSVGATNANAVSISRTGITTTVNGNLTVAENTNLNGNTTIGNATTDRLTVTSQILGGSPLVFQGATDNGFATTFAITDPTANNTITFPDASGTVLLAPAGSGNGLVQVPTSNTAGTAGANVISPTADFINGLTINGTTAATNKADALVVNQSGTGVNAATIRLQAAGALAGAEIKLENASGTTTAGLLVNRNTAGGTTTAGVSITNGAGTMTTGLNIQNSGTMTNGIQLAGAGTLTSAINLNSNATNGIIFNGTITTDITTGTNRALNIITNGTGVLTLDSGTTGQINLGTNANNKTIQIGAGGATAASSTVNIGNSTGAAQTVNIGSTSTTSTTNIYGGTGNINLLTNSSSAGVIVKSQTNSANTFQIQNSSNQNILNVSTTTTRSVEIGTQTNPASLVINNSSASATGILFNATFTDGDTYAKNLYGGTAAQITNDSAGLRFRVQGSNASSGDFLTSADNTALSMSQNTFGVIHVSLEGASDPKNELSNGGFEFGCDGWNLGACNLDTSANARSGSTAWTFSQTAASQGRDELSNQYMVVEPGEEIQVEAWLKRGAGTTGTAGYFVYYYDKSNTWISSSDNYSNAGSTSYAKISDRLTVPANAYYAQIGVTVRNTNTGAGQWWFDDVRFSKINDWSPQTIRTSTDTANAFQIQNAAGNALVNVDTTSRIVTVGSQLETSTVNIGNSTGAAQTVSIGSTNTTSTTTIQAGSGNINLNASTLQFTAGANRTINVASAALPNTLTVAAGSATGANTNGAALYLQGGSATSGNASGGNVFVQGGTGIGTGAKGLVVFDTATYLTAATQSSAADVNITQANIDSYGAVVLNATAADVDFTLTAPTLGAAAAGRVVYVTAANGSSDFTLRANVGGGVGVEQNISMRQNTTATMIWNGTQWTAAGASSSTTLQAAYDNTLSSAGGAEIVLNNTATANGLTVRNNAASPIIGGIFETQTSIGSNLFSVNNNATEFATNGGAETLGASASTFPANTWDATTGGTVDRWTTAGDNIATGAASVRVQATTNNHGARNRLSTTLTSGLTYSVSFAVRGATNFATLDVRYSPDGTVAGTTQCTTAEVVTSGIWTRINCTFVASGTITAANSMLIRQTDGTARTFYIDNLSVNINASATYAADGSVDNAGAFGTNWTAFDGDGGGAGTSTAARDTGVIYDSSASARADTSNTANMGIRNNLSITPAASTQYLVSFYARSGTGAINDLTIRYSEDGGTNFVSCVDYNTQAIGTSTWTKITCLFTADSSLPGSPNPDLIFTQATAPGGTRSIYIDALSVTLNTNNANNVQIGGANKGGPTTLFTLDRADTAPIAANNEAYLGSMYYDTTTGRIQCYEADGWGACGSAPDNIVNLNPEYAGAVLNGTGVGTMIADLCASGGGLNVNDGTSGSPTLCSSGEAKNFYKWTSPQATQQTYSIYVSYQLPSTFKGFASDDTVQLTARVDNTTNAAVTYEMFRSESGSITQCGTGETAVTTSNNVWQTVGINGNESTGCSFTTASAGAFVIFKVNVKANSNANAYVSTLNFVTTGR